MSSGSAQSIDARPIYRSRANRVGVFATFVSFVLAIAGFIASDPGSYSKTAFNNFGEFLGIVGLFGLLFSYVTVRLYFWAFKGSPRSVSEPPSTPAAQTLGLPDAPLRPGGSPNALVGVGGWLVLPIIGLILAPLRTVAGLKDYAWVFDGTFDKLNIGQQTVTLAEISVVLALGVVWPILLLRLSSRRSIRFKTGYITWLWVCIGWWFVSTFWTYVAFEPLIRSGALGLLTPKEIGQFLAQLVSTAIWIPYMLRSERVRLTYAKP
jgi:hypothetical protein